MKQSYYEASARDRVAGVLDPHSFKEILPPTRRIVSPHLEALDLPAAFDDGLAIGRGTLAGKPVLIASQEGDFMGGGVGEVHGAKLTGLLRLAVRERPSAVLLLLESGGVRLQEANAGLIAVSEVMRAILDARAAGVPVLGAIGGQYGCFGGMGIAARCCDALVMSEEARLGLSGPEVIETARGVEEFDSHDRALVWRTVGGKHRYLLGDCALLVDDSIAEFRAALIQSIGSAAPLAVESVEQEQRMLARRLQAFGGCADASDIWRCLGWNEPSAIPILDTVEFLDRAKAPPPTRPVNAMNAVGANANEHKKRPLAPTPAMDWKSVASALFPQGHDIVEQDDLLRGSGRCGGQRFAVIGTTHHAEVGVELALAMAGAVLEAVRNHPRRPLLFLIDTRGQRLRHRDELLGINSYMAHLAKCVEIARRKGHRVLGLIYDQALSGGFLPNAMMADLCAALPGAEIRVMGLPAMARIMRVPEERLIALGKDSPVFAPGAINYVRMGAIDAIWEDDLASRLLDMLGRAEVNDARAERGLERGGRSLAHPVAREIAGDD